MHDRLACIVEMEKENASLNGQVPLDVHERLGRHSTNFFTVRKVTPLEL